MTLYNLRKIKAIFYRATSQIEVTPDGKIIAATPSYRWAIGKQYVEFSRDCETLGIDIYRTRKRLKTLGVGKHVPSKPSDKEVLVRTNSTDAPP